MVKRCCYGTCNSDTRYPERLLNGVSFIPFPKPASNLEKCKRWLKLCGRPHQQLNLEILQDRRKAKHLYVCTKHFDDGKPTNENPDPKPACAYDTITPVRPPPKYRSFSEPPKKKARTALTETFSQDGNELTVYPVVRACTVDSMYDAELDSLDRSGTDAQTDETQFETNTDENRLLDVLALAAENQSLKQQIAKLILENEKHLRMAATHKKPDQEHQTGNQKLFSVEKLKENKKRMSSFTTRV